jgi:putative FmdB family regulatory protein
MPTYEYKCDACKHEWEVFQSMKDDPVKDCPSCSASAAKRQISLGTGVIMKGQTASNLAQSSAMDAPEKAFHDRFAQVSGMTTRTEED